MPGKKLITEADVLAALRKGQRVLPVTEDTLITPLARDTAREHGLTFAPYTPRPSEEPLLRVLALGSDHSGYAYKEALKPFLADLGWEILDVGTHSERPCDYPDLAYAVARLVQQGRASRGIMIDGAGLGSAMVCNKVPGIRAAPAFNEFTAWNARAHNDAQILTLGSRVLGLEVCKGVARVFLETPFEGGRHARRVEKIEQLERAFCNTP